MSEARSSGKTLPGGRARPAPSRDRRRAELAGIALLGALSISALLMLPEWFGSPVAGRIPELGEISDRKIKAPDHIEVIDERATDALRRAAVEQAPAVYDFDERRFEAVQRNLAAAFAAPNGVVLFVERIDRALALVVVIGEGVADGHLLGQIAADELEGGLAQRVLAAHPFDGFEANDFLVVRVPGQAISGYHFSVELSIGLQKSLKVTPQGFGSFEDGFDVLLDILVLLFPNRQIADHADQRCAKSAA